MTFLNDLWKKFKVDILPHQRREHAHIICPNCQSKDVKRLPPLPNQSPQQHRYQCLACKLEFDDETGTPLGTGIPPINVWMQCWYLMGYTDSTSYIAARLNLDLNLVERMIKELQRIFNVTKPSTQALNFEEWNEQAKELRKQLSDELSKKYELLNANVATTPKDTTEFRRQQNLRRTLEVEAITRPPSPHGTKPSKKKK